MKRIHSFEWEDKAWVPKFFRNYLTDGLQILMVSLKVYNPILPILKKLLAASDSSKVIDLCAGASGPWQALQSELAEAGIPVEVTLTDKYPNIKAFERVAGQLGGSIQYATQSVDAMDVPPNLQGIRTIFTGFHHFRPAQAKAILQDAVHKKAPIGVFEFTERTWLTILSGIVTIPLSVLFTTPFIRPFTLGRLFWTYIIPIVPLMTLWDGTVSNLRTYSPEELREMVAGFDEYTWEIGQTHSKGVARPLTYLIGWPI